jgi:2'-5' RNA ligase
MFTICSLSVIEMEQLSLFRSIARDPPGGMRRKPAVGGFRPDLLIFAIRPDAGVSARIAAQCAMLKVLQGLGGRFIGTDRLHITLQWVPSAREDARRFLPYAEAIVSDLSPVPLEVSFTEALSFQSGRGRYPFVLRGENPGLEALFGGLGEAMRHVGLDRFATRSFTPHMTLLYDPKLVAAQPIEPIGWQAAELTLIHSLRGLGRHDVLARWPLA